MLLVSLVTLRFEPPKLQSLSGIEILKILAANYFSGLQLFLITQAQGEDKVVLAMMN